MKEGRNLHEEFANFDLPPEIAKQYRSGNKPFGSKSNAILLFFAPRVNLCNEDYDYYSLMSIRRLEGEDDVEFKKRSKFQQFLKDQKKNFYDYSVYENKRLIRNNLKKDKNGTRTI